MQTNYQQPVCAIIRKVLLMLKHPLMKADPKTPVDVTRPSDQDLCASHFTETSIYKPYQLDISQHIHTHIHITVHIWVVTQSFIYVSLYNMER